MTATAKTEAIALMERAWKDLEARFAGLSEAQLARPVFTGEGDGWRVRDLLVHFAFWWRLGADGADHAASIGMAPDQNTTLRAFLGITTHFDDQNAQTFARWRERPTTELFAELRAARDALRAAIEKLPSELLIDADAETDHIKRYIWQPAVNHLRQHAGHIDRALNEEITT
ncbi:MAG: maleylpyruvate isomerase N-terminal domain-containing protein [Chloroflexota bacterium]